jgi:Ca2+-binding RTX toxin-like protein
MATIRWTNVSDDFWDVASNWDNGLPGSDDDVIIDVQFSSPTVTHRQEDTAVKSLTLAETLLLSGGTLAADSLNIIGGELTANTSLTVNNYTQSGGGALSYRAGALIINGTANWDYGVISGSITVNGSSNIGEGGLFLGDRFIPSVLYVKGTTTWSGNSSFRFGTITLTYGAVINNAGTWLDQNNFDSQISSLILRGGDSCRFDNYGTYRKSGNSTTTVSSSTFNNFGIVEVQQGTLNLSCYGLHTGRFDLSPGATLEFDHYTNILTPSSIITGAGTTVFNGGTTNLLGFYKLTGKTQINSGTVSLPGFATTGSYEQTGGTLNVEISEGYFDQLNVTGAATLGGTLNISLVNGFVPTVGDSFQILNFGSRIGDFSSFNGLDTGSVMFSKSFVGNSLVLTVVPKLAQTLVGTNAADILQGRDGNDILLGRGGNDRLIGGGGDDTLTGGSGKDTITTGSGSDRIVYRANTLAGAFAKSVLRSLDRITDFSSVSGDRFQIAIRNRSSLPEKLYNVGKIAKRKASTLEDALKVVYVDRDPRLPGQQPLKKNQAVFFTYGNKTYLSLNDNKTSFSSTRDLVVDTTGIEFKVGDKEIGILNVLDYFS